MQSVYILLCVCVWFRPLNKLLVFCPSPLSAVRILHHLTFCMMHGQDIKALFCHLYFLCFFCHHCFMWLCFTDSYWWEHRGDCVEREWFQLMELKSFLSNILKPLQSPYIRKQSCRICCGGFRYECPLALSPTSNIWADSQLKVKNQTSFSYHQCCAEYFNLNAGDLCSRITEGSAQQWLHVYHLSPMYVETHLRSDAVRSQAAVRLSPAFCDNLIRCVWLTQAWG